MSKLTTLPKIESLYSDVVLSAKTNELNILLNQDPSPAWIRDHPMARGVKYIPIEIVEYLLTSIFLKWRVEVKDTKILANSVLCTVRLHYLDPVSGEWEYHDGVGASSIQTDKGAAANDFSKVKNDAVMKAAPAAKSFAIKDAAGHLGKLFGKDLNRKDAIGYSALSGKFPKTKESEVFGE